MKISKITIKNYRALEDISLDFNDSMNIIYGENGTGKSSIVYAICDFFHAMTHHLPITKTVFHQERIRDESKDCYIAIEGDNGELLDEKYCTKRAIKTKIISFIPGLCEINIVNKLQPNGTLALGVELAPRFVYSRGIKNYRNLKEMLSTLINIENSKRVQEFEKNATMHYRNPILDAIRHAIKKFNSNFDNIEIVANEKNETVLCISKGGRKLNIEDQLSSGESIIISLICNICIEALKDNQDEDVIVLIDEVELSLHPKWQMQIAKVLKKVFPRVQFIITSHSPFIWYGLEKEQVIWLDYNSDRKIFRKTVEFAKGGSIENITAKFFEIESYDKDFSVDLQKVEELIRQKDNSVYQKISSLKEKYGNLPIFSKLEIMMRAYNL